MQPGKEIHAIPAKSGRNSTAQSGSVIAPASSSRVTVMPQRPPVRYWMKSRPRQPSAICAQKRNAVR